MTKEVNNNACKCGFLTATITDNLKQIHDTINFVVKHPNLKYNDKRIKALELNISKLKQDIEKSKQYCGIDPTKMNDVEFDIKMAQNYIDNNDLTKAKKWLYQANENFIFELMKCGNILKTYKL